MKNPMVVLAFAGLVLAGDAVAQGERQGELARAVAAQCAQQPTQAAYSACMASARAESTPSQEQLDRDARAGAANKAWYLRVSTQLAARGGARELALAATLRQIADRDDAAVVAADGSAPSAPAPSAQVVALRRKAAARAGTDVLANALLMQGDSAAEVQLRRSAAARWSDAEPDNLAPLLYSDAPIDTLLAEARQRRRFDLHSYDLVRWMSNAFARTPQTQAESAALRGAVAMAPDVHAAIAAMGVWSATAIPALSRLRDGCQQPMLDATPTRRSDCRQVADAMAGASDTALGEMTGLALLREGARSAGERDAALARQRQFDWQMLQWSRVAHQDADAGAATFARLLADPMIGGEQDLLARLLVDAGVSLQPPADWQPPRRE